MTEDEFLGAVVAYRKLRPYQRHGQALMNVLSKMHPEIAEGVRGSRLDPFYADSRAPMLVEHLKRQGVITGDGAPYAVDDSD